jgi:type I restriction enzyme M protein
MEHSLIEQAVIERTLRDAFDILRDASDPGTRRGNVLAMFFFKALFDIWQEQTAAYQTQYAGYPDLIEEMLGNERFVVPPEADFHALHALRHESGNGVRIDMALLALAEANDRKLRNVFQDFSFNALKFGSETQKNVMLGKLLEHFAKPELDLRPSRMGRSNMVGDVFESLLWQLAADDGKKGVESYTAPALSQLMALLMDPQPGESICDPACGTGSSLIRCAHLIREHGQSKNYALYGQEIVAGTWALARMNLYLHEEDNHRIEWGDMIANPRLTGDDGSLMRFDIVLAHLPFSVEKWALGAAEADRFGRFRHGVPPRTKSDYAFILHMIQTIKPATGRMAAIVPHGVLFRGAGEGLIRKKLIEENLLDAVIGLPEKLFYTTNIPAAMLIFRHGKSDDTVLFIDASRDFQEGKNQNLLRPQDLERVLSTYRARVPVDEYASLASREQLASNHYNLNIPRYVDPFGKKEEVDLRMLRGEREKLTLELVSLGMRMDECLTELGHE